MFPWGHSPSARRIWLFRTRHLKPSSPRWEVPGDRGLGKTSFFYYFYSRNGHCHHSTLGRFNKSNLPAVSTIKTNPQMLPELVWKPWPGFTPRFSLLDGPSCSTSPSSQLPRGFFKALLGVGTDFLEILQSLWHKEALQMSLCRESPSAAPRTPQRAV